MISNFQGITVLNMDSSAFPRQTWTPGAGRLHRRPPGHRSPGRAAEVTEKASRVAPLVNSWEFDESADGGETVGKGGWMNQGRQYVVQYINQSRAGRAFGCCGGCCGWVVVVCDGNVWGWRGERVGSCCEI